MEKKNGLAAQYSVERLECGHLGEHAVENSHNVQVDNK